MDTVIESLRGPLVELRHLAPQQGLRVFDRMATAEGAELVIASRDGASSLAISEADHDSLQPGARLRPSAPRFVPLTPERMIELGFALEHGRVSTRVVETGIRVIDLLCPLLDGGACWLLGAPYLGRMQMLEELQRRLVPRSTRQNLVFPLHPDNAQGLEATLARPDFPADTQGKVRRLWIVSEHVDNAVLADIEPLGTSRLFFGPRAPGRGYWPAIDVFASHSSGLSKGQVEFLHTELAAEVLELLAWAEELRADEAFDLLTSQRRFREAIMRSIELDVKMLMEGSAAEKTRYRTVTALERFLAQPLHIGKKINGRDGTHTAYGDTLRACRDIVSDRPPRGGYDHPARPGTSAD